MITYTTCTGCGNLLRITDGLDHHNGQPPCTPKRTRAQKLANQWIDAVIAGDTTLEAKLQTEIENLDNQPPRLGAAALHYATQYGWPVFPLRPKTKIPATRHGFKDATTDPDRITAWWKRHPDSNIGLPTGHHFDVIDIDLPQGITAMMALAELDGEIHGHVATSSGGMHYYVPPTGKGNTASPGLDYRGIGGYVVAPPSTLGPRGRAWSWVHRPSPIIRQGDTVGR